MSAKKEVRTVFVIMPFTKTPSRNRAQLYAFFQDVIKKPIEQGRFKYRYSVTRSDDTFNITEQIVRDLFNADVVICDLSGKESNPNVMYELGIRLGFSSKPVILIREANKDNKVIFDISGFYAHPYDPLNYSELVTQLKSKLHKLESGDEVYESPVLRIVKEEMPLLQTLSAGRAKALLDGISVSVKVLRRLFANDMMSYAKEVGSTINFGTNYEELLEKIEEHNDEFVELDWSKFVWQFGSQPAIDYYIANQYLIDLIDRESADTFTAFLVKYHTHFLSTTYFQGDWRSSYIYTFLGETKILIMMLDLVRILLFEEDKDKKAPINKELNRLYKESSHM